MRNTTPQTGVGVENETTDKKNNPKGLAKTSKNRNPHTIQELFMMCL